MATQRVTPMETKDPVKLAPEIYKVLLDNEQVRVLDIRLKPGGRSPMHSHPPYVIYSLNAFSKVRFTLPDGSSKDVEMKAGDTVWSDAETHSVENLGNAEAHVLNIELKKLH